LNLIGEKDEVRNPKDDLYRWTKEEAIQALKDGLGHSITVDGGLFGSGPHTSVIRFRNEEVGEKIRLLTIEGFEDRRAYILLLTFSLLVIFRRQFR
jgi:hypothetical protein